MKPREVVPSTNWARNLIHSGEVIQGKAEEEGAKVKYAVKKVEIIILPHGSTDVKAYVGDENLNKRRLRNCRQAY